MQPGGFDEIRRNRVHSNEQLFRSANEAREADAVRHGTPPASELDFICECGEVSCTTRIHLPLEKYREIHENPKRFAVQPGHELPEFEEVVEAGDGFTVVEKY